MTHWLRRIRGALGMGVAWALAWFGAGIALLLVVGPDAADVPFPLGFGLLGFLAGVSFSAVLGLVEGRRRFDEMSLPRFAGWGAVGGLVLAAGFTVVAALLGAADLDIVAVLGPVFGVAGAGSAAGSLALARMAEEPARLGEGGGVAGAGLTQRERREPLGE